MDRMGREGAGSWAEGSNEVWVNGVRVVRDATLLEQGEGSDAALEKRMGPYGCFASVLLAGPLVKDVCTTLEALFTQESVFRVRAPPNLLWSISAMKVQGNADPEANASLAAALKRAKAAGVPKDNIEKAMKKVCKFLYHFLVVLTSPGYWSKRRRRPNGYL